LPTDPRVEEGGSSADGGGFARQQVAGPQQLLERGLGDPTEEDAVVDAGPPLIAEQGVDRGVAKTAIMG